MKKLTYRLAAFLVALLMLSAAAAAAEPAAPLLPGSRTQQIMESGRSLKVRTSLKLDGEMLSSLMMMMGGGAQDEGTKTVIDTLLAAVNKIKTTAVMAKGAHSLSVATDAGELMNMQAAMDPVSFENRVTTSLLPGIGLSVDPDMISEMDLEAVFTPYLEAVAAFIDDKVAAGLTIEQGSFELPDAGAFASKTSFDLHSTLIVDFLSTMFELFKSDEQAQGFLTQMMGLVVQMQEQAGGAQAQPVPSVQELLAGMEQGLNAMKAEEDVLLLHVDVYGDSPTGATCVEVKTPKGTPEGTFVQVLTQPSEKGGQLRISFLTDRFQTFEGTEPVLPDWYAIKGKVLSGENFSATLINLSVSREADEALNNRNTKMGLEVYGGGAYNAGLAADVNYSMAGELRGGGSVTLSLFSPAPMLTFSYELQETDELPVPPAETAESLVLNQETAEASMPRLLEALAGPGLKGLLENMKTAMPEEAAMITLLVQSMMPQPSPEPQPEIQTETAPEPAVVP